MPAGAAAVVDDRVSRFVGYPITRQGSGERDRLQSRLVIVRLASAPVSFGVDEVQADAWRPEPDAVLGIIASLGFRGSELGPPGYLGDPVTTRERLERFGLDLVASYLPLRFSRGEHIDEDLSWLDGMLDVIKASAPDGSQPIAILADAFCEPDRLALAGSIDNHPETWLPRERFELLVDNLHRAAERCQRAGLDAVLHSHGGTYIETDREIRSVAERLDPMLIGICLDTGHARFGGADPTALVRDLRQLIRHVHIKDCDTNVLEAVVNEGGGLKEALRRGAFCELGAGDSNVAEVVRELIQIGYDRWLVVEQDRALAPGTTEKDLRDSQARNMAFLAGLGLLAAPV
jgi:inosose dehydratase